MKYIIVFALLISSTFKMNYNIEGKYRCDHSGRSFLLELKSNNVGILSTIFIRERFNDTIEWSEVNGTLFFSKIDSFQVLFNEKSYLLTIPDKALFSEGHILFYQDSSFLMFYNTQFDTGYKDEFYYTQKRLSGEEDNTIKELFGDRIAILMKLGYLKPLNILSLYNQSYYFKNRKK